MQTQLAQKNQALVDSLIEARQETMAVLDGEDVLRVAHPDSGWTVQDILNHLAWSEEWATKMIQKQLLGQEADIPATWLSRDVNDVMRESRKDRSIEVSFSDLGTSHENFKQIIGDVPSDRLAEKFASSWGNMSVLAIVNALVEHEAEHREEIRKAFIS